MNNTQIKKTIGQQVRFYRKANSLTQGELGAKIGADSTYITNIESSNKGVSLEKLVEICAVFNVGVSDLLPIAADGGDDADFAIRDRMIEEMMDTLKALDIPRLTLYKAILDAFPVAASLEGR